MIFKLVCLFGKTFIGFEVCLFKNNDSSGSQIVTVQSLMEFLLILCFSLVISPSFGADTIFANQSLTGDETIVSKGGNFELGFFKAGNSSNYFIGIWYTNISFNPLTIVWVANRETPISDRFISELKIVNGNLVLLNESKVPIWSTNVTTTRGLNSSTAVLLDDANLVLSDGSKSGEPIWQSFDHPVHTWLPGAKLGYDYRTNKSQLLTSWRSNEDPGVGLFSFESFTDDVEDVPFFIVSSSTESDNSMCVSS
ncbi:hypothetical protein QVD17_03720 [Tagetes erecta]|uniref:non-specific serine/threonine protein kinase n=1 Tax=Tagetes erecta TaxID=13708 RepID=A0AAD8LI20_TARER|nr:hypothetical protein QVD17_03720 [Tagetes erecta]